MKKVKLMDESKSLILFFTWLYPLLSVFIFWIMVAVVFNTFDLAIDVALYTLIFILPLYSLMLMLTRRLPLSAILTASVAFLLYYIDQYVYSARLTHIRLSDVKLISQAMRVMGRYQLTWNGEMTRRLLLFLALASFLIYIYRYYKLNYNKKGIFLMGLGLFAISTAIVLCGLIPVSHQEDFNFTADAEARGLLYSWYCQARAGALEAPEGYSKETAEKLLTAYRPTGEDNDDVRIIVIMDESLADYSLLGEPRFEDPLPFIHGLLTSDEAFEGKLAVSVFGGGTSNTEFEFLTGYSTALLPEGCTPYLQYVTHKMNNIVEELGNRSKIAIHPYYSEEWNRTQVYQFFGFDRFISGADFGSAVEMHGKSATSRPDDNIVSFGEGPLYVRGLISDKTCFERIVDEGADFTFAVTMQNHGSYVYSGDDFTNEEFVTEASRREWSGQHNLHGMLYSLQINGVDDELYRVNQYLTLSRLSDQAFEELIESLRKDSRKTLVLLFGDHQPGVMIPEHYVECAETVDMDYIVPYLLWANYDIAFEAPAYTSPNYLSAILKKNVGLPLTAWDQFRLDLMEEYPVITTNFVLNKDGNCVGTEGLKDYEIVQYMRMFD